MGNRSGVGSETLAPGTKVAYLDKRFRDVGEVVYDMGEYVAVRWPSTPKDATRDDMRITRGSLGEHKDHPLFRPFPRNRNDHPQTRNR